MKRFFIGFVLLWGALLLSSQHTAAPHTYCQQLQVSSPDYLKTRGHAFFNTESHDPTHFHRPGASDKAFFKHEVAKVEEEVDYEDELPSFKRHSSAVSYASSIFCAQTLGYFFSYSKEVLSFHKYFFYTASSRYLILLVVRI